MMHVLGAVSRCHWVGINREAAPVARRDQDVQKEAVHPHMPRTAAAKRVTPTRKKWNQEEEELSRRGRTLCLRTVSFSSSATKILMSFKSLYQSPSASQSCPWYSVDLLRYRSVLDLRTIWNKTIDVICFHGKVQASSTNLMPFPACCCPLLPFSFFCAAYLLVWRALC